MKLTPILVYDGHLESPREMFEAKDGARYTYEQAQLIGMIDRVEKKLDEIAATLRGPEQGTKE